MTIVNPFIRALLMLFATFSLSACIATNIQLFIANSAAKSKPFSVVKSIPYGNLDAQQLDVYIPAPNPDEKSKPLPVVVFFYGGCWGACGTWKKESYLFVAEALTTNNYIAVLADYRFYPDVLYPEIIADAGLAVEWVRDNIETHGGNRDNVFMMGHSAGAHLAAMLTMDERLLQKDTHDSIRGFVGLAGPYDFLPLDQEYQKILFGPPEKHPDSQPINFVDGSEPPFLLLYGNRDTVVKPRNIENLSKKARNLGVDVRTNRYNDINHAGLLGAMSSLLRNKKPVAQDVFVFLDEIANSGTTATRSEN